jgi:O-antigen/teichoic acid export membrane protein
MMGGVAASADWLASSWLQTEALPISVVAQSFIVMGAVATLRFFEGIYRSSIIGLQRQVLFNIINSTMATLRGLGAVAILAWVSPTIQAFFLWQGLISMASLTALAVTTYSILPCSERGGRFSMRALQGVGRFAGGMMGITFLALLLTQMDKILLSKLLTLSEYGYYTLAAAVAGALYQLINPIGQAWLPRLTELHSEGNNTVLIESYHLGAQLISVVMGSATALLFFFGEDVVFFWTQDLTLAVRLSPLVALLAFGNLLNGLMWMPYYTQLAHGWTSLSFITNIFAIFIIIPMLLWITPRFGAIGAASVWVILNAGYVTIAAHFMYRKILRLEKWNWYIKDILMPISVAFFTSFILHRLVSFGGNLIIQILIIICVAFAIFISASIFSSLIRDFVWTNYRNFLRTRFWI